jgi:hypothetical protein
MNKVNRYASNTRLIWEIFRKGAEVVGFLRFGFGGGMDVRH